MENNKRNLWERIWARMASALLVVVFISLEICNVPVSAANNSNGSDETFIKKETPVERKGMKSIDISQEGFDEAWVSEEELKLHFGLNQVDIENAEAEFAAECNTIQMEAPQVERENGVSGNDIILEQSEVLEEKAVCATADDAAEYLCDKMTQRRGLVTLKVTAISNTQKLAINQYARQILNQAIAYDINGAPDEGDYLYWHLGYLEWAGRENSNGTYTIQFGIEYRTTASEEKYVTKKVNSIIEKLDLKSSSLNEYEKVRLIYDYIMDQVEYDYYHYESDLNYNYMYTTYAALSDGSAVCQAYATLFYRLCEEVGISARVIAGNNDSNGVPTHGWNIVKIGSCYYNVDATWDDGDIPSHIYFLKKKAEFYGHTRDSEYSKSAFNKAFPMTSVSYKLPDMESSEVKMNASNITGKVELIDGDEFSLKATKKPKVLLFINPAENRSTSMVEKFYQIKKVEDGSCEGAIIDIYNGYYDLENPRRVMQKIIDMTESASSYKYSSDYEEGLKIKNQYEVLAGEAESNRSAIVVIDTSNKVRFYGKGLDAIITAENVIRSITNQKAEGTISSLKVSQTKNDQAKLSWKAYGGAEQYLVYRKKGNGSYYCLGSTKKTSYTDEVSAKKKYTYKVYAYEGNNRIAKSEEKILETKQILPKKGNIYTVDGNKYKVLTSTTKSKTVSFRGVTNKDVTKVEIPSTVKIHGISYKVTEIASSALKNKNKLKTVVVGGNVTKIGSKAFYGDKKLINIVIKTKKLKSVGSNAFKSISAKAQIRVPSEKYNAYKKLLKSKGQSKSVKIKK